MSIAAKNIQCLRLCVDAKRSTAGSTRTLEQALFTAAAKIIAGTY